MLCCVSDIRVSNNWEQRKLGEVAETFKSGTNISASSIHESDCFPVFGGNGIRGYTDSYNHDGDYALIGRQGALSGNMNFSTGKAYFTEHAVAVRANEFNDTKFLFYLMDKLNLGRWVTQSAQPGLAVGTLIQIKSFFPSRDEQRRISVFLTCIDSTITLHQRKLDRLDKLKNAFSQQMFPQKYELVPQLRFAGFSREWEQRKLEEVVNITMGQSPSSDFYTDNPNDYILVQGNADMKNGKVVPRVWTTQVTKMAHVGDLILSVRAPVGDIGKTDYDVVIGRGVASISGNEFIFQLFKKLKIDNFWSKLSTGSTFESINSNVIKEISIYLPTEQEQKQIGKILKTLDDTIALHQNKLDQLNNIKKAFLQKMFL